MISEMIEFNNDEVKWLNNKCNSLGIEFGNKMLFDADSMEQIVETCAEIEVFYAQEDDTANDGIIASNIITKITTHPMW